MSTVLLHRKDRKLLGAVETLRDHSQLEELKREIQSRYTFEDIIGKSEAFQKIFAILLDIAESDSTVLIEGPSGSGKELIAHRANWVSAAPRCGESSRSSGSTPTATGDRVPQAVRRPALAGAPGSPCTASTTVSETKHRNGRPFHSCYSGETRRLNPTPAVRGLAAWSISRAGHPDLAARHRVAEDDRTPVEIYQDGEFQIAGPGEPFGNS